MYSAIQTVLGEYDQRSAAEMKRMQALTPSEMMKRIDDFLLPVGPATGPSSSRKRRQRPSSRSAPRMDTRRCGSPRRLAPSAARSSPSICTQATSSMRITLREAAFADLVEFKLGDARESLV
jgi:hypothetical protein